MAVSTPRRYVEAAVIDGWAAFAFARALAHHWRDETENLPIHLLTPLEDGLAALQLAGTRWASAIGSSEAVPAEAEARCKESDHMSTSEVADMLQVSERRVRQLAGMGRLPGRQVRRVWTFDRGAVLAYQESRGAR